MNALKVLSGALDELAERQIVLRGVIDPASLAGLLKPDYQRETLRKATIEGLMEAFRDGGGRVPDVELAVRGDQYGCTDADGTYTVTGDVYIIDGLQRISAARQFASEGGKPLVGAMIHFATTEPWERERFDILNMRRTRLSPNVLLRNRTAQCPSLHRLYRLCSEESFVLYQRVSWSQYMRREELLTALSFLKTVMRLHSQFGAGRYGVLPGIWQALPPMMANVGHSTMVENIKTLFDLIDAAWGIRNILYKDRATHLKTGFLFALADVISEYSAFWSGKSLRIDRDMQKKIGQFGLHDPNVRAMACSTSSIGLLSRLIVDHLNSGKRTRRAGGGEPVSRWDPPSGVRAIHMASIPMITTYSMWSLFRNCRKAVEWRYVDQLVPLQRDRNLHFGSLIHECLQAWHQRSDLAEVLALIDRLCPNRLQDENQRRDWHLATAMMRAYATQYANEKFEVVALEKTFEGAIVNAATGAASRSFVLAGKVDGIVRIGGEYFVLEHKTAAQIDSDYLEKLWTDFQITIYSYYIEQTMGIPITGILYNVLVKAKLQQGKGETEDEYQARRAELLAKSKTGRTTAKRRMPETDEEYQQRLAEKYADPTMLHREMLYLSRDRFEILRAELWELTQAFLDARRREIFYQNTAFCFNYQRPCPYFALCRSNGNPNLIQNFYQRVAPNEELRVLPSATPAPAF